MTTKYRPWPTRIALPDGFSYAIAEQPITISMDRIIEVQNTGYDTTEVVKIINRLIGN